MKVTIVLIASGWTCPLTILAERQGAARLADRIFPICGTAYGLALVLIVLRVVR